MLPVLAIGAGVRADAAVMERRIAAGIDDAEEGASGSVSLTSSDLELTFDGSEQVVGLRFTGVGIPRGSSILSAWVQFHVDEADAADASLALRAEASDDAAPFVATARNISSRSASLGSVSWSPRAWGTPGAAGPDQRTPDLSSIVQEVVSRDGWTGNGAIALLIGGTGHRVAAAFDGSASAAALLHVEFAAPPVNAAPAVSAGSDAVVMLPSSLDLEGVAADDGLPNPPGALVVAWTLASGPAPVSFEGPFSARTTVSFTVPGSYLLRLTASDGSLASADDMAVTVTEPLNRPPQGVIVSPAGSVTVVAGTRLNFQATALDPDGDAPLRFTWDFGGGAPARRVEDPGPTVMSVPGVHTVRFTASDPRGLADPTPDTRVVTVVPAPGSRTFYASPAGSDQNDGSLVRPFRTVSYALTWLLPGDRLLLRQGTYAERVTARGAGTALAPIVIDSYPGERALIDSALPEFRFPNNQDWEMVDATLGEYRSVKSYPAGVARGYILGVAGYENRRVGLVPYASAAAFRSPWTQYVDPNTFFYVGPGVFQEADGRLHVRLAKTPEMRDSEARYGTVLRGDPADPRSLSLLISTVSSTLTVRGSYLVFRNITFQAGTRTIQLAEGAHHIVFDGVTVWGGDSALAVTGPGVSDIQVVNSRLYGDVPRWIAWSDTKSPPAPADRLRGTLVNLADGAHDISISYSHLRGGHDGVGVNDSENNVVVHHCRVENFQDDAFEIEGTQSVGRIAIYENYIANSLTAIAPGQDTPVFNGPLLVYRNIMALLRDPFVNRREGLNGWNGGARFGYEYMFKHGDGATYSTRNAHYYHNTLLLLGSAGQGINIIPKFPDDTRIANNILMTVNGEVNRNVRLAPGQILDGDLYWKMNPLDLDPLVGGEDTVGAFRQLTGLEAHGQGGIAGQGTDPMLADPPIEVEDPAALVWALTVGSENPGPQGFLLAPGSPAVGAAIQIPLHPVLGRLPDSRISRDVGALPLGTEIEEFLIFPFVY